VANVYILHTALRVSYRGGNTWFEVVQGWVAHSRLEVCSDLESLIWAIVMLFLRVCDWCRVREIRRKKRVTTEMIPTAVLRDFKVILTRVWWFMQWNRQRVKKIRFRRLKKQDWIISCFNDANGNVNAVERE